MATVHVATTGKDTNTGKQDAPVRNISRGMALARAGDTVLVRDGTYAESLKPPRQALPSLGACQGMSISAQPSRRF